MTLTEESPGGFGRRWRISSADARLPSSNRTFMISRSRRVRRVRCDMCRILGATNVACQGEAVEYARAATSSRGAFYSGASHMRLFIRSVLSAALLTAAGTLTASAEPIKFARHPHVAHGKL